MVKTRETLSFVNVRKSRTCYYAACVLVHLLRRGVVPRWIDNRLFGGWKLYLCFRAYCVLSSIIDVLKNSPVTQSQFTRASTPLRLCNGNSRHSNGHIVAISSSLLLGKGSTSCYTFCMQQVIANAQLPVTYVIVITQTARKLVRVTFSRLFLPYPLGQKSP